MVHAKQMNKSFTLPQQGGINTKQKIRKVTQECEHQLNDYTGRPKKNVR